MALSLDACLIRIRERDADIRAWVVVDPQPPLGDGPLRGVPFGVKDIIETAGLPTEYGSALYRGRRGGKDAAIVEYLRGLGAVVVGKTTTTSFAYFDPPETRNPRAPGHTPGGSSSGSAAVVADGMARFALGTQTQGSVLRPASYCGVCGFKPGFGLLSTEGVLPFAPSLDTLGFFGRTPDEMQWLWRAALGGTEEEPPPRVAYFASGLAKFSEAVEHIGATCLEPPEGFDRLLDATRAVNDYEGARTHEARWREFGERIGAKLAGLVERGLAIPEVDYQAALAHIAAMREVLAALFAAYPVILTPAATGPPPLGLASTGDPAANARWTALGVPAISIPIPGDGLPLGLQAVAAWGEESALLAAAVKFAATM